MIPGGEIWSNRNCSIFGEAGITMLQYTGLKGKNGVGIYEGDVVALGHEGTDIVKVTPAIGVVEWDDARFRIGRHTDGKFWYTFQKETRWMPIRFYMDYEDEYFPWDEMEVIGNIYENPELIDGQS